MNDSADKTEYLLLFRNTVWDKSLEPEALQAIVSQWYGWFEKLVADGKCTGGEPLKGGGKLVSGKPGAIVIDGPFAESKESIGGYFRLQVASEEEALLIAQQCPGLAYGCAVEVRAIGERCATDSAPLHRYSASIAANIATQ